MNALILAGGDWDGELNISDYFLICADSGTKHLMYLKKAPDVLLGDFDSINKDELEKYRNSGTLIKEYPIDKDYTDTALAVKYAKDKGCTKIYIAGALGGLFDHTYANITLMKNAYNDGIEITLLGNKEICFIVNQYEKKCIRKKYDRVSVFSIDQNLSAKSTGLKFPLDGLVIDKDVALGISNSMIDDCFSIEVIHGRAMVVLSND